MDEDQLSDDSPSDLDMIGSSSDETSSLDGPNTLPIFNYDPNTPHHALNSVIAAVRYWKVKTDRLKLAKYPLFAGACDAAELESFPEDIRKDAREVNNFLDNLISPNSIRDFKVFAKLRLLVAQGSCLERFRAEMKRLDYSLKCNEIWENDTVAYRCNTCALSPCMSLCATCFQSGDHTNHDYTRFFSKEGGACDCGNTDVILESGCCSRHGAKAVRPPTPPVEIVSLPERIVLKLIVRMFLMFRGWKHRREIAFGLLPSRTNELISLSTFCEQQMTSALHVVNFLQECVKFGGPMREMISTMLLDEDLYTRLTRRTSLDDLQSNSNAEVSLDWRTQERFNADRLTLIESKRLFDRFPNFQDTIELLKCHTLLDELYFWIMRMNYPQNLISFLLSMLSDHDYSYALAKRFFTWYPLSANSVRILCKQQQNFERIGPPEKPDTIMQTCGKIIHISVQMLSSEAMCRWLVDNCDLLTTVLKTMSFLTTTLSTYTRVSLHPVDRYCTSAALFDRDRIPDRFRHSVLDHENNATIAYHGYFFVMGDLQNILSHEAIAIEAILNKEAWNAYMTIVNRVQGMNECWRIIAGDHRDNDNTTVQRGFTLEFEIVASTMFHFVTAIQNKAHFEAAKVFLDDFYQKLRSWLHAVCEREDEGSIPLESLPYAAQAFLVTFHLPLHRHLSTALTHFNHIPGFNEYAKFIREDEHFLRLAVLHPLRLQAARAEHNIGMWVRNGTEMRMQVMIYAQPHINTSFHQPDIDLIRFCASNMDRNWFAKVWIATFALDEIFTYAPLERVHDAVDPTSEGMFAETMEDIEMDEAVALACSTITDVEMREEESGPSLRECYQNDPEAVAKVKQVLEDTQPNALRKAALTELKKQFASVVSDKALPRIVYNFKRGEKGSEGAMLMTREEWVDPMLAAAYRTLAELLVVRVNCGATRKEAMRADIVNMLAGPPQPYSHLRQKISDKGHKPEEVDAMFDEILNEISEYDAPDTSTQPSSMQHGAYKLKQDVWFNEFCPIYCQMKAISPRQSSKVLLMTEKMDRASLPADFKSVIWLPYRLVDFDNMDECVSKLSELLFTHHFIQTALMTVRAVAESESLSDSSYQLAVYLCTLAAHFAAKQEDEERRSELFNMFHTAYMYDGTSISLFTMMYVLFKYEAEKTGRFAELMKKITDGSIYKQRIVGGCADYLARFLSACMAHYGFRLFLCQTVDAEDEEKSVEAADASADALKQKKLAAQRRREAILEANKKKNLAAMQKFMEKEGMPEDEAEPIEDEVVEQEALYSCPICGTSDTPCKLDNPFGYLVALNPNWLPELSLPSNSKQHDLVELDMKRCNGEAIDEEQDRRRKWFGKRKSLMKTDENKLYENMLEAECGLELKTCGHTVHFQCFNNYRDSIRQQDLRVNIGQIPLFCPLCRFQVTTLMPILPNYKHSQTPIDINNPTELYAVFEDHIMDHSERVFDSRDDEESFKEHYADRLIPITSSQYWDASDLFVRPASGRNQTQLAALVKAEVERNVILKEEGFVERRIHTRGLLTKHMLFAVAVRMKGLEKEALLSAARDIFGPDVKLHKQTSGRHALYEQYKENCEKDDPITVSDICSTLHGSELMKDIIRASTAAMAEEDEDMPPLRRDEPVVEEPTLVVLREFANKANIISAFYHPSKVPLLLYDLKNLLVKLTALIRSSEHLTRTQQKEIYRSLVELLAAATLTRTLMWSQVRGGDWSALRMAKVNVDDKIAAMMNTLKQQQTSSPRSFFVDKLEMLTTLFAALYRENATTVTRLQLLLDESTEVSTNHSTVVIEQVTSFLRFADEFAEEIELLEGHELDVEVKPIQTDTAQTALISKLRIPLSRLFAMPQLMRQWSVAYQEIIVHSLNTRQRVVAREPFAWRTASLPQLPRLYDTLFSRYFQRKCVNCETVPLNPFVCLVCAKMLCLDACCHTETTSEHGYVSTMNEIEQHARNCCDQGCPMLALNAAVVIIVKSFGVQVWGSPYLDSHGEEDRNLRRGKPLYLSERRMQYLRQDFMEQEWGRASDIIPTSRLRDRLRDSYGW